MRISDWSSDVCSSDLWKAGFHRLNAAPSVIRIGRSFVSRHSDPSRYKVFQRDITLQDGFGQQAAGAAWGPPFAAGPPQGKKRPLGGQQAVGAAWGPPFFAGPPQGKKHPIGKARCRARVRK